MHEILAYMFYLLYIKYITHCKFMDFIK